MHCLSLLPLLFPLCGDDYSGKQPEQWQIQMSIGESAFAEGRLELADKAFTSASQLLDRPITAIRLAEVRIARGKYVQAEQICQRAWPRIAASDGMDSPTVARCLDVQARACAGLGIDDEAARLTHLAYKMRTKILPKDHYDIAESIHTRCALWRSYEALPLIATGMHATKGMDEAIESLKLQEKALPPGDPRLAPCLLAAARAGMGGNSDAQALAEKQLLAAIDLLIKARGEQYPLLADYWIDLALSYGLQGKLKLAEQTQEKTVKILTRLYGNGHPRLSRALAIRSMILAATPEHLAAAETAALEATRFHFSGLSDIELCVTFDRLKYPVRQTEYLLEMARRKGPAIVRFLNGKCEEPFVGREKLELLTALRRAQNKPDPLQVVVDTPEFETIFPNLPVIQASLVNRDFQKKRIGYQDGGDYRSGRMERWRFDVRDDKGKPMPVKPRQDGDGGGLSTDGVMKFGQSWDTILDMRRYIDLTPGDYTVVIEYHDYLEISSHAHTANLMVCRSEPFKLHIQPRVIDVTKQDRESTKSALQMLDEKGKVLVFEGTYSKADRDFIKPDSGAGIILSQGWKAVPTLLDTLDDPKLTPGRRAWVLVLLFSITTRHDPRYGNAVIANYDSRSHWWSVSGGRNGSIHVIGAGSGSGGLVWNADKIDESNQKQFAERWKAFRANIIVRDKTS